MNATLKNALILLPVAAGVGYASFLLYQSTHQDQTSVEAPKQREALGQLLATEHEVKRQYGDDVVWNGVAKDAVVYNKDSVRTGKDSGTVIKLNDGSTIELGESSLVVLENASGDLNVGFKAGDISATNSSQKLKIKLKDSQIDAQGADIKIKTGADEKTRIQVAKGKASITDKSNKKTDLSEDEAADVDNGEVKNVTKIAVVLNSPENKTEVKTVKSEVDQPFTWKVLDPKITSETLQVSKSNKFPDKDTTNFKAHQAVTANLTPGNYFWRVGWLGPAQKQFFTDSRQLSIGADNRLELIYPESGTQFDVDPEENQVELRWNSRIPAKAYVAEVATSPDFKSLVMNHTVSETKDLIKDLPSQKYYWRVRAFGESNQELAMSTVRHFTVAMRTPKLPELQTPANGSKVESGATIPFHWKPAPKAAEYRLVVSKDEEQTEVVKSKTVPATAGGFDWKFPAQGRYYWSVRALNDKSTVIGQSDVWNFGIHLRELGPVFELVSPKDNSEVVRDLTGKPEPVLLQWKILRPPPGPVGLSISRDPDFKNAVHEDNLKKANQEVLLRTPGLYYWKISSAMADGSKETETDARTFTLKGTVNLLSPQIIEPTDKAVIEMDQPAPVKFSWSPVADASQYHIVVQRTDPRTNLPVTVLDRVTKDATVSSSALPEGNYTWSLTSLDISGQEGLAGQPYQFSITPTKLMDAPELNAPVIK